MTADHVDRLVTRIAAGDRQAFRLLYGFLAAQTWRTAGSVLCCETAASAVTHSTFLTVWHGARAAPPRDARRWIGAIAAGRISERGRPAPAGLLAIHDEHSRLEVARLLGDGPGTVRTGPSRFRRVNPLADALTVIGAA